MKTLIGGSLAAVLGLIGLSIWFGELLQILVGLIPIILLLGGSLAIYLGFDELKDKWRESSDNNDDISISEDDSKYKNEIGKLKDEIEKLKSKKS